MPTDLSPDLSLARAVARTLAALQYPDLAAVFVGGVGTDWERAPVYPYAVVRTESAEQPRGSVSRTIRVRYVSRMQAGDSKPDPIADHVYELPGFASLAAAVQPMRDTLAAAALGAPLENIATEYDAESQFPVQTADLAITFSDPQAFGDSF